MGQEQLDHRSRIKAWAHELGAADCRVTDLALQAPAAALQQWLDQGRHGQMQWFERHLQARLDPQLVAPGAQRALVCRFHYSQLNEDVVATNPNDRTWGEQLCELEQRALRNPQVGLVSLYARGRDYHKVVRGRLAQLASLMQEHLGARVARACVDSAPVMEVALARKAGLGWQGKNTLLLHPKQGSLVFLGVILTDLALACDEPVSAHCGQCQACLDVCPTQALVAPYQLDARRCISYLTIEHEGEIAPELAARMGNRIYGCDDCQTFCPWNRWAQPSVIADFKPRAPFQHAPLLQLAQWEQTDFLRATEGSAIRRIGYARWRRNVAIALGNALAHRLGPLAPEWRHQAIALLQQRIATPDAELPLWVHATELWALAQTPETPHTSQAHKLSPTL